MSVKKNILINSEDGLTRIALSVGGKLKSIAVEQNKSSLVGNIYKGSVSRVLPGIQSAFIEIGLERSAFLYCEDANADCRTEQNIENLVSPGQEILVQVIKDSLGSKGVRVTRRIGLAGRCLVFLPGRDEVNISKKISDPDERQRLTDIVAALKPEKHGAILRTASVDASEQQIASDFKYLANFWNQIESKLKKAKTPSLLFEEQSLPVKTLRDIYDDSVSRIIVDDSKVFDELNEFLGLYIPSAAKKLRLHESKELLFDMDDIEGQIQKAVKRKVWLPSGGYLIVDRTEALTVFDVNTGRYVHEEGSRPTILNTNLEAAAEIAHQLELRNIGGIIVIDFIDMNFEEDQAKVFSLFEKALEGDRAKTNLLGFSELGLVQLTRKRTTDSWPILLTSKCPTCHGSGRIPSLETELGQLFRDIRRKLTQKNLAGLKLGLREDLLAEIKNHHLHRIADIETQYQVKITLDKSGPALSGPFAAFEISGIKH